jgi:hypothetical protein
LDEGLWVGCGGGVIGHGVFLPLTWMRLTCLVAEPVPEI